MRKRVNKEDDVTAPAEIIETSSAITVKEAGRRGGLSTSARYRSTGFYQRIGRMGGKKFAALYRDLLSEFGKRGGRPRRPSLNESVGEGDHYKKEAICGRSSDPLPPAK
ncbi:hypothetical protein ES703_99752 [subsurface metagenome]